MILPSLLSLARDPAPGLTRSKVEARNLECAELGEDAARRKFPGIIEEGGARGEYINLKAVACGTRIVAYGERPNRDELLLSDLQASAAAIAQRVIARAAGANPTWLVEAFYPDPRVAGK